MLNIRVSSSLRRVFSCQEYPSSVNSGICNHSREIVDNTGKENGIDLIMADRIYHLIAESPEDAR